MEWSTNRSLRLILTVSFGLSLFFFVSSYYVLTPLFEFLAAGTLVLGWFVLAPLAYSLADADSERAGVRERGVESDRESTADHGSRSTTPMEHLQRRYAAGDLSEAEFERKLEQLFELEEVDLDSIPHLDAQSTESETSPPKWDEFDLEREWEREWEREREREYV